MRQILPASAQTGVALAVALIMLVVLTLLALSGVRLSTMELRQSVNDEIRMNAFETAQSLVDATVRSFVNTPVLAQGVSICAHQIGTCTDVRSNMLPSDFPPTPGYTLQQDIDNSRVNVVVTGIPPLNAKPPVGTGFSITDFNAAYLQVQGIYTKNSVNLGQTQVNEGIAVVYAAPGDVVTENNANALSGT
jgi:hypothetical protein